MNNKFLIGLTLMLLTVFGCSSPIDRPAGEVKSGNKKNTDSLAQQVIIRERTSEQSTQRLRDSMGVKISTVHFEVRQENGELFGGIRLDSPENEIRGLRQPNEEVIPYQRVILFVEYPLNKPVFVELTGPARGFTRIEIVLAINKAYRRIYEEEEETARIKTLPMAQRKIENRNTTDGKYGIWGHDLSDLVLNSIDLYRGAKGEIFLDLDIDS